jgi:hypothetical protein
VRRKSNRDHPRASKYKFRPSKTGTEKRPHLAFSLADVDNPAIKAVRKEMSMPKQSGRVIDLDDYYDTPVQCCAELGWSMPGLYRRIQKGEIETITVGRTRLIKRQVEPQQAAN